MRFKKHLKKDLRFVGSCFQIGMYMFVNFIRFFVEHAVFKWDLFTVPINFVKAPVVIYLVATHFTILPLYIIYTLCFFSLMVPAVSRILPLAVIVSLFMVFAQ
jgi:hypothetical protein